MQRKLLTRPAENLDEVYSTLSTLPLIDPSEFKAFYRGEVNAVRGGDKVELIAEDLQHAHGGAYYKTLLMGHSGVGKSTEITRLGQEIAKEYRVIRFSAQTDLNAAGFQPFDVLLAMMIRLAEESVKPTEEGGAGQTLPDSLLEAIERWFATEKRTHTEQRNMEGDVSAGAGLKETSPLAKVLGLFANLKGEIKFTSDRKKEITEYRLNAIASLIELLNRMLDECNLLLRNSTRCEWLLVGEDFDKPGIPPNLIESLFINYANIFHNLRSHLIFTIPIALVYSEKAAQLPLPWECINDTPVFDQEHQPYKPGRVALRTVLEARMIPDLFEPEQMERLIVASGGNIRDLFEMASRAARSAAVRTDGQGKINATDTKSAIAEKRSDYVRRLGTGPFDVQPISYEDKAKLLVDIYNQQPGYNVPNPTLYSLLRARAVQEFNGERWFGVHPLVVDILVANGKLTSEFGGPVHGGTD